MCINPFHAAYEFDSSMPLSVKQIVWKVKPDDTVIRYHNEKQRMVHTSIRWHIYMHVVSTVWSDGSESVFGGKHMYTSPTRKHSKECCYIQTKMMNK